MRRPGFRESRSLNEPIEATELLLLVVIYETRSM
jgi:hypothetical protein